MEVEGMGRGGEPDEARGGDVDGVASGDAAAGDERVEAALACPRRPGPRRPRRPASCRWRGAASGFKSRLGPRSNRQATLASPENASGGSPERRICSAPSIVRATPPPSSTTNQRATSGKRENGPSASISATLTRTRQSPPSGQANSSRVTPPPLRQGCGGVAARATRRGVMG
jgi:hypothetical protein